MFAPFAAAHHPVLPKPTGPIPKRLPDPCNSTAVFGGMALM
jgi:hypothetical protein